MDKIKTVKIKNPDGSISEESYTISVDAKNVDMDNGKELQETIGNIDIDRDGSIAEQLDKCKGYDVNKINKADIVDNLNSTDSTKVLSAKQGNELNNEKADKATISSKKNYYSESIGTFQNEQEERYTTYGDYIDFGEPNEPPLLDEIPYKGFDVIAHFYNDFGLKSTAMSSTQAYGSWKWYDWSWNFTNKSSYDTQRVPLLGYYQGDDRKTLDWILYWLGKAGVNVLSIVKTSGLSMNDWANESSVNHWFYVLMNQCKNISNFKILPWLLGTYNKTTTDYENSKNNVLDFIENYKDNIHIYYYNNKRYVCVYTFSLSAMRGPFDNYQGNTNTINFLKGFASDLIDLGYDGLCLLCRDTTTTISMGYNYIDDGLILYNAEYANIGANITTYEEYANKELTATENTVMGVMTATLSSPEHTSTWNVPGSTPELFQKALNHRIQHMLKYNLPKMITIYNVSEWAEGGPGLIPNIQDGFGYLDAVGGCQIFAGDTINKQMIMNETRDIVFAKSHDFIATKRSLTSIEQGSTAKEFSDLTSYFNYTYNQSNYVFIASLQTPTYLPGVTVGVKPDFGGGRIYAMISNTSGQDYTNLTNVYVNLLIFKKNVL